MLLTPPIKAVGAPRETPSIKNSTVPVAAFGITVAVKVMFVLSQDGLLLEVTVVVVAVCALSCKCEKQRNRNVMNALTILRWGIAKFSIKGFQFYTQSSYNLIGVITTSIIAKEYKCSIRDSFD